MIGLDVIPPKYLRNKTSESVNAEIHLVHCHVLLALLSLGFPGIHRLLSDVTELMLRNCLHQNSNPHLFFYHFCFIPSGCQGNIMLKISSLKCTPGRCLTIN